MGEKRIDLGLTALDELFMTEEGRQENRLPRIRQIPLDMIDDMPDHPFKVRRDDDMELLHNQKRLLKLTKILTLIKNNAILLMH